MKGPFDEDLARNIGNRAWLWLLQNWWSKDGGHAVHEYLECTQESWLLKRSREAESKGRHP